MQTASTISLIEEQLDVTLRLLFGISSPITPNELDVIADDFLMIYHAHFSRFPVYFG